MRCRFALATWLAIMCLVATAAPCGSTGFQGNEMRLQWRDVQFALPSSFRDESSYHFRGKDPDEELVVSEGTYSPAAASLDAVVHAIRTAHQEVAADRAAFVEDRPAVVAGRPAHVLGIVFSESGRKSKEWVAVVSLDPGYVQIAFAESAADRFGGEKFRQALDNASLADQPAPSPTPRGFVRRRAASLAIDVPEDLEGPAEYSFTGPDGVRLRIRFHMSYDIQSPRGLDDCVKATLRAGDVTADMTSESKTAPNATTAIARFLVAHEDVDGTRRERRSVALVAFTNGVRVVVSARGPEHSGNAVEAAVAALLRSIELVK